MDGKSTNIIVITFIVMSILIGIVNILLIYLYTSFEKPESSFSTESIQMHGSIDMGGNSIRNVAIPLVGTDAANRNFVESLNTGNLKADGSVVLIDTLDANSNHISNVALPTLGHHAVNKTFVDRENSSNLKADGSVTLTAAMNAGGFKLTNVANPTLSGDVVTKGYGDANYNGSSSDIYTVSLVSSDTVLSLPSTSSTLVVSVDSSSDPVSITLPSATQVTKIVVVDSTGDSATNPITIIADGTDTIAGEIDYILSGSFYSIQLYSNTNGRWFLS